VAFFESLQNSAFTDWFLGSESIWTYATVLTLHTIGLAILVAASVVIHLRVLDVGSTVPMARLTPLYRFIWVGFGINLVSGLVLFVTQAADRITDPVFALKMASIGVAMWIGVAVRRRALDRADGSTPRKALNKALSVAALGLWTTAIVTGRLMAYLGG
jgi:hypothetical protein